MGTDAYADVPVLTSKSYILMEASTGTVIASSNEKEHLSPASITKIMTLILIFEALQNQEMKLADIVTTSAYASSMGGSQVFLEEGETQSVETMIKCIVIASANDASVAMAEHLYGTEKSFVDAMNQKAQELGMMDTHFEDCCGLSDSAEHYTCANDVALMSRELITKHPEIYTYTQIWMEDITHVTRKGSSLFTLSSTNKLIKQYKWATGLKTGSTSKAKYCLSATANKNDIDMIAVVMAAPDHKIRFTEAVTLLEYGFSVSKIYRDKNDEKLKSVPILGSTKKNLDIAFEDEFVYLDTTKKDLQNVKKEIKLKDGLQAPIKQGDVVGEAEYILDSDIIGKVNIISKETVKKSTYKDYFFSLTKQFLF